MSDYNEDSFDDSFDSASGSDNEVEVQVERGVQPPIFAGGSLHGSALSSMFGSILPPPTSKKEQHQHTVRGSAVIRTLEVEYPEDGR